MMRCPDCGADNAAGSTYCTSCGAKMQRLRIPASPGEPGWPGDAPVTDRSLYGGFWRRFAALLIDMLVLGCGFLVLGIIVSLVAPGSLQEDDWRINLLSSLVTWLYFAGTQSSAAQASPGQRAMDLRVTDLRGMRISFARATGRHFAKILSGLSMGFGYLMNLFTARRQTLHDVVAGTLVVGVHAPATAVAAGLPGFRRSGLQVVALLLACVLPFVLVGFATAVALPAWQEYETRAQVASALAAAEPLKSAVATAAADGRPWEQIGTESLGGAGDTLPAHVREISVEGGRIQLLFADDAAAGLAGGLLSLTPAVSATGEVRWICGRPPPPPGFHAVVADHAQGTTLEARYLPRSCR